MTKSEIRKIVKDNLEKEKENLAAYSHSICKKIILSDDFKKADYILAYSALQDEVDLSFVINKAFEEGKKVALPKILTENSTMIFCEISKEDFNQLQEGYYGIKEPDKDALEINNIDGNILILTPGRAFTLDGKRMGRGKGFYDKFFSLIKKTSVKKVGICFNKQLFDSIPTDEYDIPMDSIIYN